MLDASGSVVDAHAHAQVVSQSLEQATIDVWMQIALIFVLGVVAVWTTGLAYEGARNMVRAMRAHSHKLRNADLAARRQRRAGRSKAEAQSRAIAQAEWARLTPMEQLTLLPLTEHEAKKAFQALPKTHKKLGKRKSIERMSTLQGMSKGKAKSAFKKKPFLDRLRNAVQSADDAATAGAIVQAHPKRVATALEVLGPLDAAVGDDGDGQRRLDGADRRPVALDHALLLKHGF